MSYAKVVLIGNLGQDPELSYTPQGDAVCKFSLAVNDRKKDQNGEYQDVTTWFKVTTWRKLAENASKYLAKGRAVYIEGKLSLDEWQDRDGNNKFTLAVNASEMQFLGGREGGSDSDYPRGRTEEAALEQQKAMNRAEHEAWAPKAQSSPADDDIPFALLFAFIGLTTIAATIGQAVI